MAREGRSTRAGLKAAAVVLSGATVVMTAAPVWAAPSTTTTTTTGTTTTTAPGGFGAAHPTTSTSSTTAPTTSTSSTTAPTTTAPTTSEPSTTTTAASTTTTPFEQPTTTSTTTEPSTSVTEPETPTTVEPPTTSTPVPVDETPGAAATAPPLGAEQDPVLGEGSADPVAVAAQLAYAAFAPWRDAVAARADAHAALATAEAKPGVATDDLTAATAAITAARTKVASLSLGYRYARDALADAVIARAGRPADDAVELSAIWERTDPRRLAVVFSALTQVGDPYVFAAAGPDRFDCSGLTLYAWKAAGVSLVHYAITQREQTLDAAPDGLQPGDLVFRFRQTGGHVMLYLGEKDLVVQAGGTATGVAVSPWGRTDAFGSPLAAQTAPAPATTPWFGATAGSQRVGADVPFADAFNVVGARYGVAPALLAAIASAGTGFRADAAATGAGGVMQLRPAIAAALHVDAAVPFQAVDGAARRLLDLWNRLHDESLVLAAYRSSLVTVNEGAVVRQDATTDAFASAVTAALAR
jgi:cell wall-associated NlpC family hydrolase